MATFTSSLPQELLDQLSKTASELKVPKNKLIQKALSRYLIQIDKAQFAKSFQRAAKDPDMLEMAEEGIEDWFKMLEELEQE